MKIRCLGCMETYDKEYSICPHCGYAQNTPAEEAIHMQPGIILHDRYIIGKVLGFGGFGVTYIGWDGRLEQKVAIKEYLPSEFSTRMPGQSMLTVFNGEKSEQFRDGLVKFVDEARRLAKFKNEEGIVKVFDSFEENETAYIIMEYLNGETLTSRLKREERIPEDEAVNMMLPILESLRNVHEEGIIHRDIAPDNIFLTSDGGVKLIDFGASRFATTSHSRSLTVIIKPGYSPEEQYRSRGDQGPHTDVYAVAAVLYKMITGKTPPDAMERRAKIETQKKELLVEPHKLNKSISRIRENAILNAMNVRIEDRTSDVDSFLQELNADTPVKRRYGKIKKIDLYTWPLWLKISLIGFISIIGIFGVLLATGVISFSSLFSSDVVVPDRMVTVPDVESMDKDEAIKTLEEMNIFCSSEGNVSSEFILPGKVVLQSPNAGEYILEYGTVFLTISSGKAVEKAVSGVSTVPYIIWDTREDAIKKLIAAGLGEPIIVEQYDDTVQAGKVINQDIEYGAKLDEGTVITITVSLGPEKFKLPNVKNMSEEQALLLLEKLGLNVTVTRITDDSIEKGNVISQSLEPGTEAKADDEIEIIVSKGEKKKKAKKNASDEKDSVNNNNQDTETENKGDNVTENKGDTITENKEDNVLSSTEEHVHKYVTIVTKKETCGEAGERTYICQCGDSFKETIPATGLHSYISEITVQPEVGKTGIRTYYCLNCGDTYTDLVPTLTASPSAHIHNYSEHVVREATCSKAGEIEYICSCGNQYTNVIPATGLHSYKSEITTEPKVGKKGVRTYYCTLCDYSYTETIPALVGEEDDSAAVHIHDYSEYVVKEATCAKDGEKEYTCSCGDCYTMVIPATGLHNYKSEVTKEATCGASGIRTNTCIVCSESYTETIPPTELHNYVSAVSKEASCGEEGQRSYYCTVCGNTFYETIPKVGVHDYSSEITVQPGVGVKGVRKYTCNVCGDTYTEEIPALTSSDWTEASRVPAGAEILEQKWVYTRTEKKESTNNSESGWDRVGDYWTETGRGSVRYASFPDGYDTGNWYYQNYDKGPLSAYDDGKTKREVSNDWGGFIYWHWMYRVNYAAVTNRAISNRYGSYNQWGKNGDGALLYQYFYAFDSSADCPYLDNYYCCSQNLRSYDCHGYIPDTSVMGTGTDRFFRFDTYISYYTDYQKIYKYQKVTAGLESLTEVKVGGEITEVIKYVKYSVK